MKVRNRAAVRRVCLVIFCAIFWVLALSATALMARAENNNCGEPPDPAHYVAQPGDTEDAQHIAMERSFTGQGKLELNV